ncbi:MAG: DUF4416 family protein [Candidatus Ornithospirochaeta sp.]|nr:DUF4416 family protein [Candidatus Ornithospirochaeta sp.]
MEKRDYDNAMLFMGVLSVKGFPDALRKRLEEEFGPILSISEPFPFSFTDYYVPEMGEGIERFFISFSTLISPDRLAYIKTVTNGIEAEWAEDGGRRINLDPGTLTESNVVLATTKNRAHRIAIGLDLYGEVTLMYQNHGFRSFDWTYADYRSERVQKVLMDFRKSYLGLRKGQNR